MYTKTYYFEDPQVELYSKLRGWLHKKKDFSYRAQLGFNKGSLPVWFCFFERGKILGYFKDEPKDVSNIINVIYVSQIQQVDENIDNKKEHFKILLRPCQKAKEADSMIHIKCKNDLDRTNWIKAIRFFKEYYKDINQQKNLEDELDIETQARIQAEIELSQWS